MLHVITTGARRMIADLELMLGFRLCMRCVWWFTWVFIIPALLTVSTQNLPITDKYELRNFNIKMCFRIELNNGYNYLHGLFSQETVYGLLRRRS